MVADKQISYAEMGDLLLGEQNVYSSDNLRKAYYVLQKIVDKIDSNCQVTDNDVVNEITRLKRELEIERIKISTEKLEYRRWLREQARDELICEKICNSIRQIEPLKIPNLIVPLRNNKSYSLLLGDCHFGIEFDIKDLFGNSINTYSPEIFEQRMWDLFNQTLDIIREENISELNIMNLGDDIDGLLRMGQLIKLRYGVVDSTTKYANFISNWLNEFTKYVKVKFHMTLGNHSELRMLGASKGTFTDDNMGKIIAEFIKIRLEKNPNFEMIENPTGYIFTNMSGYSLMGIHGEVKNMKTALDDYSRIYHTQINYLVAGHLHHSRTEEIGYDTEVINIPSIVSVDSYAMSLRKTSSSAAKLLVFEENKGKTREYTLKLN